MQFYLFSWPDDAIIPIYILSDGYHSCNCSVAGKLQYIFCRKDDAIMNILRKDGAIVPIFYCWMMELYLCRRDTEVVPILWDG
jgi:hypothetical protein